MHTDKLEENKTCQMKSWPYQSQKEFAADFSGTRILSIKRKKKKDFLNSQIRAKLSDVGGFLSQIPACFHMYLQDLKATKSL